ncbi:MAG: SET domain-containing protein-lysine N-methyltransferase [Bryobacteraceae bacterium]|nr:SET domain-containing protein-lysine N-methyltransferase [Bryobacteraceae bacterium]
MPKAQPPTRAQAPSITPKYACFQLSVRPSEIHRWGVYAEEFIPKGRKVIEYTGERCNRRETAKRAGGKLNYMFTLDSYWALDGSVGGSGAEYINHCCDPNCYAWVFRGHILYMAAREIQAGEELTIDYHFEAEVEPVKCACGSPNCRGTINLKPEPKKRKPATKRSKNAKKAKR